MDPNDIPREDPPISPPASAASTLPTKVPSSSAGGPLTLDVSSTGGPQNAPPQAAPVALSSLAGPLWRRLLSHPVTGALGLLGTLVGAVLSWLSLASVEPKFYTTPV